MSIQQDQGRTPPETYSVDPAAVADAMLRRGHRALAATFARRPAAAPPPWSLSDGGTRPPGGSPTGRADGPPPTRR